MTEADDETVAALRGGIEDAAGRGGLLQLWPTLNNDESIGRHGLALGSHGEVKPIREHLAKHIRRAQPRCGRGSVRLDVVPLAVHPRREPGESVRRVGWNAVAFADKRYCVDRCCYQVSVRKDS